MAIRLEHERTSLCFVSSHLAAHTDGTEKRNKDYQEICKHLILDGMAITDHDMVFWMGDLNYRYVKLTIHLILYSSFGNLKTNIAIFLIIHIFHV